MNRAGSPLFRIRYSRRASDICRFVDDPADVAVADVVRAAELATPDERKALRAVLDSADCYTLLSFAQRRAAAAIRDSSASAVREAVQALTLVSLDMIDRRDFGVDFQLYAARRVGVEPTALIASAVGMSEPGTAASFAAASSRAARLTLKDCALTEVMSSYGLGFMETWSRPFTPQSDLAEIAVRMADGIEAMRRYEVDGLRVSSLPRVWFSHSARTTDDVPVSGCVTISASIPDRSRWEHGLLIFLAEVGSKQEAEGLVRQAAEASSNDRPRVADSHDRVLWTIVGGSATRGQMPLETLDSLRSISDRLGAEIAR